VGLDIENESKVLFVNLFVNL